ncbi:NAD(P)/FAD-dependent oxidoreductase [Aerophototrophica crusticola]|uniref:NAD(P)/FAD-dependent oxidoreductase n=1 Tax=Aerophototrophica crusticola TaxID=1709002 RepID=A0A858R8F8_9PROT|nr:NAD(P)/FAD-dependent oxidoreductase [Rhodospirillaceae bacterium B3]
MTTHFDVLIIGAGAAGLYAAIFAGRRGRRVLVVDHADKAGKKILISGGGRCNFTNLHADPKRFISKNPHFAISALKRHSQHDFIALVDRHGIPWHEKKLGQLFCDRSAQDIVAMLLDECADAGVALRLECKVQAVGRGEPGGFTLSTSHGTFTGDSLVLATGGLSIPKMGATGFALDVARQFGLPIVEPRPALVPFTFRPDDLARTKDLSGIALDGTVRCDGVGFREALLITHRGLSGPSVLQISSYWREGMPVTVDLSPDQPLADTLKALKRSRPRAELKTVLAELLPRRFAERLFEAPVLGEAPLVSRPLADMRDADLATVAARLHGWTVQPEGTEGYRTAEVMLGGIDTAALSSKTMETKAVPGLYAVGEAVDVTGWLGGYNFQWAWSSGYAAGMAA